MNLLLLRPPSGLKKILPMGLLYIAGYLRDRLAGIDIRILDLRQMKAWEARLCDTVMENKPDIIGISAVNMEASLVSAMINVISALDPQIKIIIGGPYATSLSSHALKDGRVYCCVIGEGEETALEIVRNLMDGGKVDLSSIGGIAYNGASGYVKTPQRDFIADLDSIPMPAYDLIAVSDYFRDFGTHAGITAHREYSSIFTSRGCPYRCIYCHDIFGKKIRYHSAGRVFTELKILYEKYGVREIHIEDDSFNIDKDRVKRIFDMLIDGGLKLKICFPNGIRVDAINEEILDLFGTAGVYKLSYGIESGSVAIQKAIKKNLNLEAAKKVITMTVRKGIVTQGFFMLGFLGETEEDIRKTIDFAVDSDLHMASFSFVIPQPGTPLYYQAIESGCNLTDLDTDQLNPGDTNINISAVPTETLHNLRRTAYRRFYLKPGRMLRLYLTVPRKKILFKSFLVFMSNILPLKISIREKVQASLYK